MSNITQEKDRLFEEVLRAVPEKHHARYKAWHDLVSEHLPDDYKTKVYREILEIVAKNPDDHFKSHHFIGDPGLDSVHETMEDYLEGKIS